MLLLSHLIAVDGSIEIKGVDTILMQKVLGKSLEALRCTTIILSALKLNKPHLATKFSHKSSVERVLESGCDQDWMFRLFTVLALDPYMYMVFRQDVQVMRMAVGIMEREGAIQFVSLFCEEPFVQDLLLTKSIVTMLMQLDNTVSKLILSCVVSNKKTLLIARTILYKDGLQHLVN